MRYFLLQPGNNLAHLPDFKFESGSLTNTEEVRSMGGCLTLMAGKKLPDTCKFTKPCGAIFDDPSVCKVVNERGIGMHVNVINQNARVISGVIYRSDNTDYSADSVAMEKIQAATLVSR